MYTPHQPVLNLADSKYSENFHFGNFEHIPMKSREIQIVNNCVRESTCIGHILNYIKREKRLPSHSVCIAGQS